MASLIPFKEKKTKEGYLLVSFYPNSIRLKFFRKKNSNLFLSKEFFFEGKLEENFKKVNKKIAKESKRSSLNEVIVLGSSNFIYSFLGRASLIRDHKFSVNQQELELLLLRGERALYEKYRKDALWHLKTDLDHIEFVSAWVDKIFVNDHLVISPIGFKARSVSFLIGNSLIDSNFFLLLKSNLPALFNLSAQCRYCSFFEESFAYLFALSRLPFQRFLFLEIYQGQTMLSLLDFYYGNLSRFVLEEGVHSLLLERIKNNFQVETSSAKKIFDLFKEERLSAFWEKKLLILKKKSLSAFSDIVCYLIEKIPSCQLKDINKLIVYFPDREKLSLVPYLRRKLKEKRKTSKRWQISEISRKDLVDLLDLKDFIINEKQSAKKSEEEKFREMLEVSLFLRPRNESMSKILRKLIRRIK